MYRKLFAVLASLCVLTVLFGCAAPTPQIIEVEKQVVVEKKVVETVVVEATRVPEVKPYEGVEVNVLTFTGPQIADDRGEDQRHRRPLQ
jgi:uncharacterized protein YcfL